jgi:hypothetical protein
VRSRSAALKHRYIVEILLLADQRAIDHLHTRAQDSDESVRDLALFHLTGLAKAWKGKLWGSESQKTRSCIFTRGAAARGSTSACSRSCANGTKCDRCCRRRRRRGGTAPAARRRRVGSPNALTEVNAGVAGRCCGPRSAAPCHWACGGEVLAGYRLPRTASVGWCRARGVMNRRTKADWIHSRHIVGRTVTLEARP